MGFRSRAQQLKNRNDQGILQDGQRPQGLTSADRDEDTQRSIAMQNGQTYSATQPINMQSYTFPAETPRMRMTFSQRADFMRLKEETYEQGLADFRKQFYVGKNVNPGSVLSEIKEIAKAVSPYYRKFQASDRITLTDDDWKELAAQYAAYYGSYGEDKANEFLATAIKDNVAENQPYWEKAWYALAGMGADAVGSTIATAGLFYGLSTSIAGAYEKDKNLNGWQNFWNNVIDNDVTSYGSDVVKYGTILHLNEAKEQGLPYTEIQSTSDQANSFLSANTPFELIQQGGFTVASVFAGTAYSKLANWGFKGAKKGLMATNKTLTETKNMLSHVQKAQNINNRYVIPALTGTTEGVIEGLETKRNIQETGYAQAAAAQQQETQAIVNKMLSEDYITMLDHSTEVPTPRYYDKNTGEEIKVEDLYKQVWDSLSPKYQESLEQVDYAASRAGICNFFTNSAINGAMNMTFKAALQAQPVRDALRNGKLTKWAFPKSQFKITGNAGNIKVTPYMSKLLKGWQYIKEPVGEFKEEYLQTLSDSFYTGFADANIHSFIDNKYNGDARAAVGDWCAEDWGAALTALGNNLVSKESMKAGVYGALSSIMGTAKINGYRANNGIIFGKGVKANGEKESTWEMIQRLTPWRSGLVSNIRRVNEEMKAAETQAKALQEWLVDPNNRGKFDGLGGSWSWIREMNESAIVGDEYNYRNASLGKMISDIYMLQKAKGSEYYNATMQQLTDIAYMEANSDEAKSYIDAMRANVNYDNENKTDEQIFNELKTNAQNILELMSKVEKESDKIDELIGVTDEDVKQSLIYGQLSLDDWEKRSSDMEKELTSVEIENSTEHSDASLTPDQKKGIANGSIHNATKMIEQLEKKKAAYQKDIDGLNKRKDNLSKPEEAKLKELKVNVQSIDKLLKTAKDIASIPEGINTVLNESEIMALDPVSRARLILRGKQDEYAKLHQGTDIRTDEENRGPEELDNPREDTETQAKRNGISKEQQAVIDNLINQGTAKDKNFLSKIVDVGRVEAARTRFLKQYNSILTDSNGLQRYAIEAKKQADDAMAIKTGQQLAEIENYQDFAASMDKALDTMSERSKRALLKSLAGNPNYEEWKKQRKVLEKLMFTMAYNDKFKELDGNSADLFMLATTYLYDKGVNLNDTDAVWNALTEVDGEGYNKFVSYFNKQNEEVPSDQQTVFTSVENVFQIYKNVLDQVDYDTAVQERLNAPIDNDPNATPATPIPNPVPVAQAEPTTEEIIPETTPEGVTTGEGQTSRVGIFGTNHAFNNPEGDMAAEQLPPAQNTPRGYALADENAAANQEPEAPATPTNPEDEVMSNILGESQKENAVKMRNSINASVASSTPEAQSKANEKLNEIPEDDFDDVEKIKNDVFKLAAELETHDDDNDVLAASLLRRAAASLTAPQSSERKTLSTRNPAGTYDRNPNPASSVMSTIDIAYVKSRYPNYPIAKFYEKYDIERFLSSNDIMANSPDIFFITDDALTEAVKKNFADLGNTYTDGDLPVIAVVKSDTGGYEFDENGTKVRYQPIGIMPANNARYSMGSSNMVRIRSLAEGNKGVAFVTYQGKPLHTKPNGKGGGIRAIPVDMNQKEHNSVQTIFENDYYTDEREALARLSSNADRRNSPIYQKAKRRLIKNLGVGTLDNGHKMVAYMQSNMKDGKVNTILAFVTDIANTTGRNTDKTLIELLNEDANTSDILNFNSRTKGVARSVKKFLEHMPSTKEATSEDIEAIKNSAKELGDNISRYIEVVPVGVSTYKITPVSGEAGITSEGERQFTLSIVNTETGEEIELAKFDKNSDSELLSKNVIAHILMDGGSLRTINGEPVARWQVDYNEVEKAKQGDKKASDNVSDWIDDNILEFAATTFQYAIKQVDMESPFKADGTLRFTTDVNAVNATSPTPMNVPVVGVEQVSSGNAIVDGDTGAPLQGETKPPVNQALITVEQKVAEITQNSKLFELSPDGKSYVNTKTGRVYARVTSIIAADEQSSERFDPNSVWTVPSTNIGTTVDEFVRDFFAGTLKRRVIRRTQPVQQQTGEVTIEHTPKGKTRQTYTIRGSHIYNKQGREVFTTDSADRNKIFANLAVQQGRAVVVEHRGRQYVVNDKNQILSGTTGKITNWGNENGDKKAILEKALEKFNAQRAGTTTEATEYDYPNATNAQWEAFRQQLENLKLQMEANGFHVVPRDIVSAGSIDVLDGENKTHKIDVAGTLDLLAYDDQGNFYIFDMKTVHNMNTVEYKKHKWSQQTSLYQKFLENAYGIKIKNRHIIPISVSYPDARTNQYTQGEGTSINLNGVPFADAAPHLEKTISVPFYEPHIMYDKLTPEEKELAGGIEELARSSENEMTAPAVEAAVEPPAIPYEDPITGLNMDTSSDDLLDGLWHDPMLDGIKSFDINRGVTMPEEMKWENLTADQKSVLQSIGYTEESYSKIDTKDELDHMKECLGL